MEVKYHCFFRITPILMYNIDYRTFYKLIYAAKFTTSIDHSSAMVFRFFSMHTVLFLCCAVFLLPQRCDEVKAVLCHIAVDLL